MNSTARQVKEFHEAFGQPVADTPTLGDVKLRKLRLKLILSEALELADALGLSAYACTSERKDVHTIRIEVNNDTPDIVAVADALGDLDYVVQGGNLAFGVPGEAILAEIHKSNMTKLGADGKPIVHSDGKVIKGPNYKEPDLGPLLQDVPG